MTDLSARIQSLSPEKRRLLEARLKQQGVSLKHLPIPEQDRDCDGFPLSFAQERLWFLDQLQPDLTAYNMHLTLRLQGSLSPALLQQSLNALVARHETLRTTFHSAETGDPLQSVAATQTVALEQLSLAPDETEADALSLIHDRIQQPFDLSTGPLMRVTLIELGRDDHLLLFVLHHIICDGWSISLLFRELVTLYGERWRKQESSLSPLPIQYADFACWQRDWLQGPNLARQLDYWRDHLKGIPTLLQLPTDFARPAMQSYRGAIYRQQISAEITQRTIAFSQDANATPFMTLLAVYQLLLARYAGQNDVVVGSPIANRNRRELEGLIGFFANILPFRTQIDPDESFGSLLGRVRQHALDGYNHQDLPFEKLIDDLAIPRSMSHAPIFQVAFILQNAPRSEFDLGNLTMRVVTAESDSAKYDLTLTVLENDDGYRLLWEYNTDLFKEESVAEMAASFAHLLDQALTHSHLPVSQLSLVSPAEQQRLLVAWNDTSAEIPPHAYPQLLEAQVARTPDNIAVRFGDASLTYRDLNERANQLAHHLRSCGVGPDVFVGLCLPRNLEMLVSLLAVMKAGGAYIPLDPSYPQERLSYMLADASAAVLVTQADLAARFPDFDGEIVAVDGHSAEIQRHSSQNPAPLAGPHHLAYVIYTSGSTGKPKGVQIPHRPLVNFLTTMANQPGISAEDRVLAVTTISFDIATLELYLPLMVGADIVLATQEQAADGYALAELLATSGASVMQATPSTWQMLLAAEWQATPGLKILSGGEALSQELARQLLARGDSLWNVYGPTETTVWSTCMQVSAEILDQDSVMSIGRPIANTEIYILDSHHKPVPVGVVGDLYIGGEGLARGYLNRPRLTAERFVPHPFSDVDGARLYQTGDLARYLPDGRIAFLGRADHQIKLRGFRIETGEIEARLSQHDAIREAVVVVNETTQHGKRLVAYLTLQPDQTMPSVDALRSFLNETLPSYMLPALFVTLDAFPLTPNGKIDRKALPEPHSGRLDLDSQFVPPRSDTETMLCDIWRSLLSVKRVGVYDNFFSLGGDSLLSVRFIALARKQGLSTSLKQVFQTPTVAQLAEHMASASAEIDPISADQSLIVESVALTCNQHWFFSQTTSNRNHFNVASLLEVPETIDPALVEAATAELLRHHDALRMRFTPHADGNWSARIVAPSAEVPFVHVDIGDQPEASHPDQIEAIVNEQHLSLDLVNGPLFRVALITRGAGRSSRLFVTVHHQVCDGYSLRVLLDDLQTAYLALSQQQDVALPPKTTSVKAWAQHLVELANSAELETDLLDWFDEVGEIDFDLPRDFPDATPADNVEGSIGKVVTRLSAEDTDALLHDVLPQVQASLMDVLLSAFTRTISQWAGAPKMPLVVMNNGRHHLPGTERYDLSRTVGSLAMNAYTVLQDDPSRPLADVIPSIQAQYQATPIRGLAFDLIHCCSTNQPLVERIQRQWIPQIKFNYMGQFDTRQNGDALARPAPEPPGKHATLGHQRDEQIYCLSRVVNGVFTMAWWYSQTFHRQATIQTVADAFVSQLGDLIASAQRQPTLHQS